MKIRSHVRCSVRIHSDMLYVQRESSVSTQKAGGPDRDSLAHLTTDGKQRPTPTEAPIKEAATTSCKPSNAETVTAEGQQLHGPTNEHIGTQIPVPDTKRLRSCESSRCQW